MKSSGIEIFEKFIMSRSDAFRLTILSIIEFMFEYDLQAKIAILNSINIRSGLVDNLGLAPDPDALLVQIERLRKF